MVLREADEFLVAMTLHVAADHAAVEHVEGGEQGGRAVALVVVRHGTGAAGLHRQARLGAVERLDLALLIDREHDGMRRRVDIEANDISELLGELRVLGELEGA
jgi:dihydroxyacetone kinase